MKLGGPAEVVEPREAILRVLSKEFDVVKTA
jgi:hypothetical protein